MNYDLPSLGNLAYYLYNMNSEQILFTNEIWRIWWKLMEDFFSATKFNTCCKLLNASLIKNNSSDLINLEYIKSPNLRLIGHFSFLNFFCCCSQVKKLALLIHLNDYVSFIYSLIWLNFLKIRSLNSKHVYFSKTKKKNNYNKFSLPLIHHQTNLFLPS